nr:hypothetical protein [Candidatus Sigynarchaeota archaeon]
MDAEKIVELKHQKLKRWGGGFGLTIPPAVADSSRLTMKDKLTVIILRENKEEKSS